MGRKPRIKQAAASEEIPGKPLLVLKGGKFGVIRMMCPLDPSREARPGCPLLFQNPGARAEEVKAGHREDAGISTGANCCHSLYPKVRMEAGAGEVPDRLPERRKKRKSHRKNDRRVGINA